jgi:hypothetical protein
LFHLLLFFWFFHVKRARLSAEQQREHCLLVTLTNLSFQPDLSPRGRLLLLPSLVKRGSSDWGAPGPVALRQQARQVLLH